MIDLDKKISRVALFIFLAWALATSFEFWAFGSASYVKIPDAADHILASRLAIKENIAQNENGLWSPDQLAGIDRFAQADSLGILDWLFVGLPGWLAYGGLMFAQRFIAGYFTFRLLTRHLRVNSIAAVFPAMLYAIFPQRQINVQFEGFTVYDTLVTPGVPLILYLLGSFAQSARDKVWVNLGFAFLIGLVFANLSSFIFTIFFFPLVALWLLFVYPADRKVGAGIFVAFFAGWFCYEFFSLYATYYFSSLSQRVYRESCIGPGSSFHPLKSFYAHVFKPENFPLVGAGILTCSFGKQSYRRTAIILLAMAAGYFLLSQYFPLFACGPFNVLGIPTGLNYSRFYIYLPFLLVVLGAVGLHGVFAILIRKHGAYKILGGVFISLLILIPVRITIKAQRATLAARAAGSNFANVFSNPYLQFLAEQASADGTPYRVAALNDTNARIPISTGFLWAYGLNTIDGYTRLYTDEFSKYWMLVLSPLLREYEECRFALKLLDGNNRVMLSNACDAGEDIDITQSEAWFDLDLLSLAGVKYFVSTKPLETELLTPMDTTLISCPASIPGCSKYFLYENPAALPLAFSLADSFIVPAEEKLGPRLSSSSFSDLQTLAFILEHDAAGLPLRQLGASESRVNITSYSSDLLGIEFFSDAGKILLLNWSYTPDWVATIDGELVRVFPVDLAFMGIYVPAGQHTIEFEYSPPYTPEAIAKSIWRSIR